MRPTATFGTLISRKKATVAGAQSHAEQIKTFLLYSAFTFPQSTFNAP
jgi:hypothetical protein